MQQSLFFGRILVVVYFWQDTCSSVLFGRILVLVYFWQDTCSSVFLAGYATVQRAGVGGTGGGDQALVLWEGARLRNQVRRCPTHRTPCPTYTRPINKKKVQRGGDAGVGGSCKDPTVRCSARRGLVSLFIHHIHSHIHTRSGCYAGEVVYIPSSWFHATCNRVCVRVRAHAHVCVCVCVRLARFCPPSM